MGHYDSSYEYDYQLESSKRLDKIESILTMIDDIKKKFDPSEKLYSKRHLDTLSDLENELIVRKMTIKGLGKLQ